MGGPVLHRFATPGDAMASVAAPLDAAARLVFNGGRDLVSDVWVSGRHLVNSRAFPPGSTGRTRRIVWPRGVFRRASEISI